MSDNQPYIGALVTLISSLDVRYEGTLFTIDPNESTVALQNVRCLGTEERQSGSKAIPPSDTVYEFIIFRGENIKSINIAEEKSAKPNELQDPSILKLGPKNTKRQRPRVNNELEKFYDRTQAAPAKYNRRQNQNFDRRDNRRYNDDRGYNRRRQEPRRYERRNQRPQRNNKPRVNPGDAKFLTVQDSNKEELKLTEEFDFKAFDKNDVVTEKKEEPTVKEAEEKPEEPAKAENADENAEAAPKSQEEQKEQSPEPEKQNPAYEYSYDPDNFFDDLDLVDRSRMDFKARRKIDAQTFGEEASSYKVRRRRRRGNNRRRRPRYNNNRYNR